MRHLDVLKYLHEKGCPGAEYYDIYSDDEYDNEETCQGAARVGYLDVLEDLHENGCSWDEWTCTLSAGKSHLDVLKYAHENGCP